MYRYILSCCLLAVYSRVSGTAIATYDSSYQFDLHTAGVNVADWHYQLHTLATRYAQQRLAGTLPIPPLAGSQSATSTHPPVSATASSSFGLTDYSPTHVSGSIAVSGTATSDYVWFGPSNPPPATATSLSRLSFGAGSDTAAGHVTWMPTLSASVTPLYDLSQVNGSTANFSIGFSGKDATTGTPFDNLIFSMRADLASGDSLQWAGGLLSATLDSWNYRGPSTFDILLDSPWSQQQGSVHIAAQRGAIIAASATGIYAGLTLPAIGSAPVFTLPLGSVSFDYDFASVAAHSRNTTLDFEASGIAKIPEPGTALLTLIGSLAMLGLSGNARAVQRRKPSGSPN